MFLKLSNQCWAVDSAWEYIPYDINAQAIRSDGSVVFAGENGFYHILDSDGTTVLVSGFWKYGEYGINTLVLLEDDKVLMAGEGGFYQILKKDNSLGTSGQWGGGSYSINTSVKRADGKAVLAGDEGYVEFVESNGTLDESSLLKWGMGSQEADYNIYAAACRSDGIIVLGGENGYYQKISAEGALVSPGNWWNNGSCDISAMAARSDDVIIMAGDDGFYQTIDAYGALLDTEKWWDNLSREIKVLKALANGSVIMAGQEGYYQKLLLTDELEAGDWWKYRVNSVNSIAENLSSKLIMAGEDGFYMIYNPIQVIDFTDRVTAANYWMDTPEEIQAFNYYILKANIVSKFVIDPAGESYDSYEVQIDLNSRGNDEISIDSGDVVRITNLSNGIRLSAQNKQIINNGRNISFNVPGGSNSKIEIYFKYKVDKKNEAALSESKKTVINKVTVTGIKGTERNAVTPVSNTIKIKDIKIILM